MSFSKTNLVAVFVGVLFLGLISIILSGLCDGVAFGTNKICTVLTADILSYTFWALVVFLVTLLPALFALPFNQKIFKTFSRYFIFNIGAVLIITFFITRMDTWGGWLFDLHPGIIYLPILYGTHFIFSFLIIAITWYKNRN